VRQTDELYTEVAKSVVRHFRVIWEKIDMIWYDIYSFAPGTTITIKQSSDNSTK